jgi:pyrimidine operon attenuation protein / uracil phosphoribosyltransferase
MTAASKLIFNQQHLDITIRRLCYQLIENHDDFKNSVLIGIQPRGIYLSRRILRGLLSIQPDKEIKHGELDISFYRDDFRRRELIVPSVTNIEFPVENKKVILVDDVLYTGRTIRAAMDALLAFGRPEKVELLVLVNRKFSRHLPIDPDYIGIGIDTITSDKVKVLWKETEGEDGVWLTQQEKENE